MHTLRKIGIIGGAAALLLSSSVAFAESSGSSTGRGEDRRPVVSTTTGVIMRDSDSDRLDKLNARLSEIKDKAKADLAARLALQFANINKTWTDHFANQLNRYDAILVKMQKRSDIASAAGKNVSSTTAAIQSSKAAIAVARTAVIAQAAKSYVPVASTLPTTTGSDSSGQGELMKALKDSFKTLHASLFKDLFALRDGPMKNVRTSMTNVLQTLTKIPGVDND